MSPIQQPCAFCMWHHSGHSGCPCVEPGKTLTIPTISFTFPHVMSLVICKFICSHKEHITQGHARQTHSLALTHTKRCGPVSTSDVVTLEGMWRRTSYNSDRYSRLLHSLTAFIFKMSVQCLTSVLKYTTFLIVSHMVKP